MIKTLAAKANAQPVLFAGIAAATILGTAFGFQLAGYPPCEMCWWQRYPYMAVIAVALICQIVRSVPQKPVLLLLALTFAIDAGIAGFHVGVEQRWWEGLTTCSSFVSATDDINAALAAIMDAPVIRCDEIAWSLFGISMAGYNFIAALVMTLFCVKQSQNNSPAS